MKKYALICLMLFLSFMSLIQPVLSQNKIDAYPDEVIYFGYGGGFTGLVYSYAVLSNGDLYKKKPFQDQEYEYLGRLEATKIDSVFKNYQFFGIHSMQLSEPGNTYSFIRFKDTSKSEHKLTWAKSLPIPGNLKSFYEQLIALLPKQ